MRAFLKQILATFIGLILFTTVGIAGLALLLISIASQTGDTTVEVEDKSVLTLDLSQGITDASPADDPRGLVEAALVGDGSETPSIALRTVLETLEHAAKDDRIVGLYVHGSTSAVLTGSGFATLREVRQALEAFRAAGKPIYAYDDTQWQERDYYLASVANTIGLHPTSLLEINGFSTETPFFAGALQKYGIGVQVLRVGRYKAGVEPFIRSSSSPEDREQTQRLLTDLWNEFRIATGKSRKLTVQKLQAIADQQGLLLPEQAKAAGLVDKVAYADEVVTELQQLTDEQQKDTDSFRQIDLAEYATAIAPDQERSSENRIAVVYAEGSIVSGEGGVATIGGDSFSRLLRKLRQDEDIKAIVLRVNSPGGSASASEMIAREVLLTKKEKPVIVSMGSAAASGGYQISAHANRIFASPTTITGSIGVFGVLVNVQEIANRNGITWDRVKTARLADGNGISRPRTKEELAIGQRIVDRIYDQFLAIVATSRPISKQKVAEVAQGRVWSGLEAQKLGLVDELGGLEDAIQAAAEAAKLGDDWELEEYPRPRSFEAQILRQLLSLQVFNQFLNRQTPASLNPLTLELQGLQDELETWRSMNDPQGMYMRLPFNPRID